MGRHRKRVVSYSPLNSHGKARLFADAEAAADVIAADLGIRKGAISIASVMERCEKYGGKPYFVDSLGGAYGWCITSPQGESRILIACDMGMSTKQWATVIIHELTHRLHYSPAYEWLNTVEQKPYSRDDFQEALARAVESRFVQAGGHYVG